MKKIINLFRLEPRIDKLKLINFESTLPLKVLLRWKIYTIGCSFLALFQDKKKKNNVLEEKGFCILGKINFDMDELGIKTAAEHIEEVFKQGPANKTYLDLPRINHPPLEEFVANFLEAYTENICELLGSNFQAYWTYTYRTLAGGVNALDSSFAWHYDEYHPKLYKIFIYLGDTFARNGAFRTFDKTISRDLFRKGFISNTQERRVRSQALISDQILRQCHTIEGVAGTAFIFDNKLVHRGTYPLEGQRTVICIEVYPSHHPFKSSNARNSVFMPMSDDFPAFPWRNPYAAGLST